MPLEYSATNWGRLALRPEIKATAYSPLTTCQVGSHVLLSTKPESPLTLYSFSTIWKGPHPREDCMKGTVLLVGTGRAERFHLLPPWINRSGNIY